METELALLIALLGSCTANFFMGLTNRRLMKSLENCKRMSKNK